eukprot:TRINITY_DN59255_c0_g1_i1.p1 TRINITY_DN59255_c0_g1~~TRINITY_DN59255_c0_g1_i1.p1  ORF type:complete len:296 (-),score=80.84 TRINITY_DN59255_c0_g1_i1:342-1229(-)
MAPTKKSKVVRRVVKVKKKGKGKPKRLSSETLVQQAPCEAAGGAPPDAATAEEDDVEAQLQNISLVDRGLASCTRGWLTRRHTEALRQDALALLKAGAFTKGEVTDVYSGGRRSDAKQRLCDTCGLFDDAAEAEGVGDEEAREALFDRLAELREQLMKELGRPLAENMELQYLHYTVSGGFFSRHCDVESADFSRDLRRSVSLLVFLNEEGWDAKRDGGVLRAYPKGKAPIDINPDAGTLVLFDSCTLEHEVLPTHRERWALVGWFLHSEEERQRQEAAKTGCKRGRTGKKRRRR